MYRSLFQQKCLRNSVKLRSNFYTNFCSEVRGNKERNLRFLLALLLHNTVFQIIKFKPWGNGQAWLIYCAFELQWSHYLNCLSSFHGQLLVDSTDRIHQCLCVITGLAHFISEYSIVVQTSHHRACLLLGCLSMVIFILGMHPGRSWLVVHGFGL